MVNKMKLSQLFVFLTLLLISSTSYANKIQYIDLPLGLAVGTTEKNLFPHPLLETPNFSTGLVLRPLTAFDENRRIVCKLCKDLPKIVDENSVRITLEKDIFWGDGTPVTTNDIVFTWQAGLTQNIEKFQQIKDIEVKDSRVATIIWQKPPFNPQDFSFFWLIAAHVESLALKEPALYRDKTRYRLNKLDAGLYNGPYMPDRIEDDYINFKRNPAWNGAYPKIDSITVNKLPDTNALAETFIKKETLAFEEYDIEENYQRRKRNRYIPMPPEKPILLGTALVLPGEIPTQTMLNNDSIFEVLKNPAIEANLVYLEADKDLPAPLKLSLLQAIDFEKLLSLGLKDTFTIADHIFPNQEKPALPKNLSGKSIEELMQQAGFTKKDDFWQKNDKPVIIGFSLERALPWRNLAQQFIKNDWQDAGFKVDVITDDKDLPASSKSANVDYNLELRTYSIPLDINPKSFVNAENRVIPLLFEPTIYGTSTRLKNVTITASPISLSVEDWIAERPSRFE